MDSLFTNLDGTPIAFEKIKYEHLSQLVDFDEGYKIEFKSIFDAAVQKKLPKSICSFANCSGGWIFIGIANNTKEIIDIPKPNGEIELNIINSIKRFVDLEVLNLINVRFIENPNNLGYGVIAIHIKEGLHPPYISNGTIYVRAGAQSDPVPAERATVDYLYKKSDRTSILLLKGIFDKNVQSTFKVKYVSDHLQFKEKIDSIKQDIITKIEQCCINLPSSPHRIAKFSSQNTPYHIADGLTTLSRGKEQDINKFLSKNIDIIKEFVRVLPIDCNINYLLSFGDLQVYYQSSTRSTTLIGSEVEKRKYHDIIDLSLEIERFCSLLPLYQVSEYLYRVDLAISNEGNYYDEDIVLSLNIPKNSCYNFSKLKLFSYANCSNQILLKTTANNIPSMVDEYDNYGLYPHTVAPLESLGLSGLVENKEEKLKQECENELEYLYSPFEIINNDEYSDTIKIKFNKINPNQTISLPAPLFFNCELSELQYSIVSKYSAQKIIASIKRA